VLQDLPARPGMHVDEVDTPALVVDLDALEANLDSMAEFCAAAGVALRAHAKTHKSPVIAGWQADRGAVGQCVQKVGEAEVLAWGGVRDILVSNEVVSPAKLARLAALRSVSHVAVCADNLFVVDQIERAAEANGSRLEVLVEVDVGGGRCGVAPGRPAVELAQRIASSRHLAFGGLQAYHGTAQHLRTPEERERASATGADSTRLTIEALEGVGLSCGIVGGAGTGTFAVDAASGVYTELQAGSYIFMDADYGLNHPAPPFRQSLFVLSSVISVAPADGVVVDCGHKGVAVDSGLPLVHDRPGITYVGASDEHGSLLVEGPTERPKIDERVKLVPGHCDPTVDRYDWYVGVRGDRVEMLWPVAARGRMS
jgi:3-hydroxy-D-aspartate aldolase